MNGRHNKQAGIVLVTSLLALLVVSVVVSAMLMTTGSANSMAYNAQVHNQAFQSAESAVDFMLENDSLIYDSMDIASGASAAWNAVAFDNARVQSRGQALYLGEGLPLGASLDQTKTLKFEVLAEGYIADPVAASTAFEAVDADAKTQITQGLYRIIYVDNE